MMRDPDRLYELMPVVHRQRDVARGEPLRALLQVISEQVGVIEDDLDQQYANWFIETCDDWVVPYIGALIGYQSPPQLADADRPELVASVLTPRRAVANAIRDRRRKGTLPLLERIAQDTAGWPARAVEFYRLLVWTQALNFQHPQRGRTADLRDGPALARIGGPFDTVARSVDVRGINTTRTRGTHNIPQVGLYVWRLKPYLIDRGPAFAREDVGMGCYTFSLLGNDMPLFNLPRPDTQPDAIAGPRDLPAAIARHDLANGIADYYGAGQSLAIWADDWPRRGQSGLIPADQIRVADLDHWHYRPDRDHVAVDPVLGRIAFHPRQLPGGKVTVRHVYAFSDDTGSGPYPRPPRQPADAVIYRVGAGADFATIGAALAKLRTDDPDDAVIEITDAGAYSEPLNIALRTDQSLQLRARDGTRATLRLLDFGASVSDAMRITGEVGSRFTLSGLVIAGRGLQITGPLATVRIDHTTLVPGWQIGPDCSPMRPNETSLALVDCTADVTIHRAIMGAIQISMDEVGADPVAVAISDSVIDATADTREAIGAPSWPLAHATLTIRRTTVVGSVQTHAIALAEDSIFTGPVFVARRQIGCIRFCHVPAGSRTPRRYRCQPDLAERAALDALPAPAAGGAVYVPLSPSDAPPPAPAPAPEHANLRLNFVTTNPAPAVGEVFVLTLTLDNLGPRDATSIAITLIAPRQAADPDRSPFASGSIITVSHGTLPEDDDDPVWQIPQLAPGDSAVLTATLSLVAEAAPPRITAEITAHVFADVGHAYRDALRDAARAAMRPIFTDRHYGHPGSYQLHLCTDPGIRDGASDGAEMGAFHDLFQPQRHAALSARLDDNVPAGMSAGIIFVT